MIFYTLIVLAVAMLFIMGLSFYMMTRIMEVAGPEEMIVQTSPGYPENQRMSPRLESKITIDGRTLINPFNQDCERMDISPIDIDKTIDDARFRDGVTSPINIKASVGFTISPEFIHRPIQKFLGRPRQEVALAAEKIVESGIRELSSVLDREQFSGDLARVSERAGQTIEMDLENLGFELETLTVEMQ